MTPILQVPTTVFFGFLGVGKTSAIINLFEQKPADQRWAVLVNEFGKLGIDQHIYQQQGISVKTVSGGCMCCAQGAPLRVAINQLLRESEPHRLLIESSGVGHPDGVLKTLNDEGFRESLQLKASICLIDPMHLLQDKYRGNDLFQQQIRLADILIANKIDQSNPQAIQAFHQLEASFTPAKQWVGTTSHGRVDLNLLDLTRSTTTTGFHLPSITEPTANPTYYSSTFQFDASVVFDLQRLTQWLEHLPATRLKGIIKAKDHSYLVNLADQSLSIIALTTEPEELSGSYIEVIADQIDEQSIQRALQQCQLGQTGISDIDKSH